MSAAVGVPEELLDDAVSQNEDFCLHLFHLQTISTSATAGQDSHCVCCGFDGEGTTTRKQECRFGVYLPTAASRAFPVGFVEAEN